MFKITKLLILVSSIFLVFNEYYSFFSANDISDRIAHDAPGLPPVILDFKEWIEQIRKWYGVVE